MKTFVKAAAALSVASVLAITPASAQDTESFVINLSGSVPSNCELIPEGSGNFNVNMLNTGNQGTLTILYSCNSPYTVSLQSLNGGMLNSTSGGVILSFGHDAIADTADDGGNRRRECQN